MQKPLIPALFICFLLVLGCGKSNVDLPDNVDRWYVSFCDVTSVDHDLTDYTALFDGYLFEFAADDVLFITAPNGNLQEAKWAAFSSTEFAIGIENPTVPLEYVNGDWDILEYTATSIKLKSNFDYSNTFAKTWQLEFTKQ